MKHDFPKVIKLTILFLFTLLISCSKDSDLFADAILNDKYGDVEERDREEQVAENGDPIHVFSATNDVYIQGSTTFDQSIVRLQQDYRTSYLMFDLGAIDGEITQAKLQFTINADDGNGQINVYKGVSSDWTEETLTESNAPSPGY